MKKQIFFYAVFLVLIIPTVASAAWWNPISWFNRWTFQKTEKVDFFQSDQPFEQINEDIVIPDVISSEKEKTNLVNSQKKDTNLNNLPVKGSSEDSKDTNKSVAEKGEDFRAECTVSKKEAKLDEYVKASLKLYFQESKNFVVNWPEANRVKLISWNEAMFQVDDYGEFDFSPTVRRISDGYTKKIPCYTEVLCDKYECLSAQEKKVYKLKQILDEVQSWSNNEYSSLTAADRCNISESVIRAYEYEYVLLGGTPLPAFSKPLDCASNLSVAAYEYRLKLFLDSL